MPKVNKKSLKSELIKSHLSIAGIGVVLLIVSLVFFIWLQSTMRSLTDINMPMVQSTENIQASLQASLAGLRGWVNVKDAKFKTERKKAWINEIEPNLSHLKRLVKQSGDEELYGMVQELAGDLYDLKAWQWYIEDTAQAPGNNLTSTFMRQQIEPSGQQMISMLTNLIEIEKTKSKAKQSVGFVLADLRGYTTKALSALNNYAMTNSVAKRRLSLSSLNVVRDKMLLLNKESQYLTDEQKLIYNNLVVKIGNFPKQVNIMLKLSKQKNNNLANYWLAEKAVPLARRSDRELKQIVVLELKKQSAMMAKVNTLSIAFNVTLGGFIVLLLILSLLLAMKNAKKIIYPITLLLSATQRLASGGHGKDIEVVSHDEIGELTVSFNTMNHQRHLSEEKTKQIIETAYDPIITINREGVVQSCNTATTELLGYTKEELVGNNVTMIMPEPHKTQHGEYLNNYHKTHTRKVIGKSREMTAISRSDVAIPVILSVSEVKFGDEVLYTGILRDIRLQKEQERKVEEFNIRLSSDIKVKSTIADLESLLRGVDDIDDIGEKVLVFMSKYFDARLSIFYVCDKNEAIDSVVSNFGFGIEQKNEDLLKENAGLIEQCIAKADIITLDEITSNDMSLRAGTVELVPKQLILLPLICSAKTIGVVELCVMQPLADDKIQLLKSISDNIAIYLNMANAKNEVSRLLAESQAKTMSLQQQEEELRSSNEELNSQANALKQAEEELRSTNEELHMQMKLVKEKSVSIEKKSEEIEKVSKYKSEFLANMSHELRTPLNSLLILAQSFVKNKVGNLTEDQVEEAQIIYDAGNDLLTLINDILDISKVEAGKLTLEYGVVAVRDIKQQLLRQFKPIADKAIVGFEIDISQAESCTFECDQLRMFQILKNLLSNAFKFTENGSVKICVHVVGDSIHFDVTDTGIGIEEDKVDLVFSEFQQADGSTSRKYGGTGLGLSISKKLANLMHGDLSLTSEFNKGSTFTLILPLKNSELESGSPVTVSAVSDRLIIECPELLDELPVFMSDDRDRFDNSKPSLLLIDDDEGFCKSISSVIKQNNFQLLIACDAQSGLMSAAFFQPSCIILDLGLPDADGGDVLSALKADDRTKSIPVHIISARDKTSEYVGAGALSFLQKPIKHEDLESLLGFIDNNGSNNILIVEDDQISCKNIQQTFSELDDKINIEFASTSTEAKQLLSDKLYSCVVVDLGLPDQFGLDLIKNLVEEMSITVPIVVYTARELTPDEHKQILSYTSNIVIKGAKSSERLFDEVSLFMHHVSSKKPDLQSTIDIDIASEKLQGITVLLVDDDLRNTFALSRALEDVGLKVIIADNGKVALAKLAEHSGIDLVLMDIMMPVMDGYEAMGAIRKDPTLKGIPIIALTANATQQDKEKCIQAGASDYMSKPVNVDAIIQLIVLWMSNPGG
ncbi:MAG: response regulator [Coxiellaceae bacterium]|nr:response regulator [Coxiellaceae bacterium]